MMRLEGSDLSITKEMCLIDQHDNQSFVMDYFKEWSINTDGEVNILVL